MVDWAYVCGMADDTGNDPDEETHDPDGRAGVAFHRPGVRTYTPAAARSIQHSTSVYGPPLRCRHCGTAGLYWQAVNGKHRIFEHATLTLHVCATSAEGFGDVDESEL